MTRHEDINAEQDDRICGTHTEGENSKTNKNHGHYDTHPVCIIHFVSILINQNVFDDIIADNVWN